MHTVDVRFPLRRYPAQFFRNMYLFSYLVMYPYWQLKSDRKRQNAGKHSCLKVSSMKKVLTKTGDRNSNMLLGPALKKGCIFTVHIGRMGKGNVFNLCVSSRLVVGGYPTRS